MNRTLREAACVLPQFADHGRPTGCHLTGRLRKAATKSHRTPKTMARLELELALAGDPCPEATARRLVAAGLEVVA